MTVYPFTKSILFVCFFISWKVLAQTEPKEILIDIVSGQKVDKAESFDWTYAGKKYYFNSYDTRASFKMNPQKYLLNQCTSDMKITDPVCGMEVNKEKSYDMNYKGKTYYFDSYECKETFKMNPEKFVKNACAPQDSIK